MNILKDTKSSRNTAKLFNAGAKNEMNTTPVVHDYDTGERVTSLQQWSA